MRVSHSKEIRTAVLIGAGNLAWHLGHHLQEAGISIVQVYNRTPQNGKLLADELKAGFTGFIDHISPNADIYIMAVSDDAISPIAASGFFRHRSMVVHTAGSVGLDVFNGMAENYGVIYPLQTFTKGKKIDFKPIPVFIESNSDVNEERIRQLALKLSDHVYSVDSEKRMYLHLAAVIASNFTNHLLALTKKMLHDYNLDFELLAPLMQETIAKALLISPDKAQTGPAARGNKAVIDKHLTLLKDHPEIRELYRVISESIRAMKSE